MKYKDARWSPNLYQEICIDDTYRLRRWIATVSTRPTTVYDIGAHLGCFAAWARHLWADARLVCVEPHPSNFAVLCDVAAALGHATPVNAALGRVHVYWVPAIGGDSNPGGHGDVSDSVGYPEGQIRSDLQPAACPAISLAELAVRYPSDGPYVVKIDCEGGEECLFDDPASNAVLRGAAYWTAELHFFAARAREIPAVDRLAPALLGTHGHVIRACLDWCYGFSDTLKVELELLPNSGMIWCTRRTT